MRALFVQPEFPDTFWSLRGTAGFLSAKIFLPPLGLLTVAGMLPREWPLKMVDLNVEPLPEKDLDWAEMVFVGAMEIQSKSAGEVVRRCNEKGVPVVAGGPHFSLIREGFERIDYLFAGEVEETLPRFLEDLAQGRAQPVYRAEKFPELGQTPIPRWDLVDRGKYLSMPLQVGRGCPNDCDFCHVVILNGRRPRLKSAAQVKAELDSLYASGWKEGELMIVDDNIIGHKRKVKPILETIASWQKEHKYPYKISVQVSLDVADDDELLDLMVRAGFLTLFLGIESPSDASLEECHKNQNRNRDIVDSVRRITDKGMLVVGGFILGFDADNESSFQAMVDFIEACPIPYPMVGLLSVPPDTRLWDRMEAQGRLLGYPTGDQVGDVAALNYIPLMGSQTLLAGYCWTLKRLYEPTAYYNRVVKYIKRLPAHPCFVNRLKPGEIKAFFRVLWKMGLADAGRLQFWKYLGAALLANPRVFPMAVTLAASGRHHMAYHGRVIRRLEEQLAGMVDG